MSSPVGVPTREIGYANAAARSWWRVTAQEPTPELRWPACIGVYAQMRKDAQVASVLRAVKHAVRRTPWRIDPAGARDEVVDQIADDLGLQIKGAGTPTRRKRSRDRFSWQDHLRLALLKLDYGHSVFEQRYRIDGEGAAARVRLHKLAERPQSTISAINVDLDGGLVSVEQYPPSAPLPGAARGRTHDPIPVSRLVVYTNDREGGDWVGQSLMRSMYPYWLLKHRLLRVQAQTVERNGMGVPRYTSATAGEDLAAGQKLASDWRSGAAAGAAIPFGAKLDLVGVSGTLPDADTPIRYYDEQIAKAALLHFLNLGQQAGTGSYALGATFADFFTSSLQAVAEDNRDVAQSHVVEDLVDLNWGPDEVAPQLVFDEIGSHHEATAAAIKMLLDSGALFADRELEEHLRQVYSLPPKASRTPPPGGTQ